MSAESEITLPSFSDKRLNLLVYCGTFKPDATFAKTAFTKKGNWQYAEYRRKGTVRSKIGRTLSYDEKRLHFHVEFSPSGWSWVADETPETILKRDEFRQIMDAFVTNEYAARITAYFTTSVDELPAFIKYAAMNIKSDNIEMRMTKGQYKIVGAPIQQIEWTATKDPKTYTVGLQLRDSRLFSTSYFEDTITLMERAYGAFFHTEATDAK